MRTPTALLACLVLVPALAAPALAAEAPPPPAVHALRAPAPIRVDGVLDDAAWAAAEPVTAFLQADPDQGAAPRLRTDARIAFDDEALYVAARMYDSAPESIGTQLARRDNGTAGDLFEAYFDPLHDQRSGYYFAVSAAGTLLDGVLYNDGWNDDSWDGAWSARVRRDSLGWTAEMRIPYSQLRFRPGVAWGVNFRRFVSRWSEDDRVVYTPRGQSGYVSRFAPLTGLEAPPPGHSVELLPYTSGRLEYLEHDPADPFRTGGRAGGAVGGDLRTRVGSRLILNATVNPDFGQVEVDPAVVNLSDLETYFQEKRPFFTEGVSIFRTGNNGANDYWGFNWADPTFFYARRIGRTPQGRPPREAEFADLPVGTRVLGAAKLTGQLAPGWNFGTLHAVTRREEADVQVGGARDRIGVEPLTYYGAVRTVREMNDRRQALGILAQTAIRRFDGAEPLRDQVNGSGTAIIADGWTFLDSDRTWVLSGWSGVSSITGSRARITALQRSSPHYYQRPDTRALGVDPDATSLQGAGARVWLNKQNGHLLSNSAIGFLTPGLDLNDMGYQTRTDVINAHAGIGWQWDQPNTWRQYANVIGAVAASWDFEGIETFRGVYVGGYLQQRNQWSWNASAFLLAPELSDRKTRGGPLMAVKAREVANASFSSNPQHRLSWSVSSSPNFTHDGSYEWNVNPAVQWRPAPRLSVQAGPNLDRTHVDTQYVTSHADADADATYGRRYAFARLDQTTLSADLRMDLQLTPALGLQAYAQPLVSTARYSRYGELARARGGEVVGYAPGAIPDWVPDLSFTLRTVQANTVLRWEYRVNSTLYVVWTQQRTRFGPEDVFDLERSLADIGHAPPNDIFLVKVTHHFDV